MPGKKYDDRPMTDGVIALIGSFSEAMENSPTTQELLEIRRKMDSWLFRENVRQALRGINSRERIGEIRDALRNLQRSAEDLASRRDNWRENFRIAGIGGGIGLAGSALITAVTVATPAVAILPLAGTVIAIWHSMVHSNRASHEINLLRQISEIAGQLADSRES